MKLNLGISPVNNVKPKSLSLSKVTNKLSLIKQPEKSLVQKFKLKFIRPLYRKRFPTKIDQLIKDYLSSYNIRNNYNNSNYGQVMISLHISWFNDYADFMWLRKSNDISEDTIYAFLDSLYISIYHMNRAKSSLKMLLRFHWQLNTDFLEQKRLHYNEYRRSYNKSKKTLQYKICPISSRQE